MAEPLFGFGLSQEDERTEAHALAVAAGPRVLSVCSAGDMPLSLLALGAASVEAVDVHPGQLHLARLKAAAVAGLEREAAIRFLGFHPASSRERAGALREVLPGLPSATRRFWERNRRAALAGVIWAGRYERYVRRLVRLALPLLGRGRFLRLFDAADIAEQRAHFDRAFDRPALRAVFRLAFHPRVYARRGLDPTGLSQRAAASSLGDQFFARFRDLCTATPARENHLLQLTLLGRTLSSDAVPAWLSRDGFRRARERLDRLTFVEQDLVERVAAAPPGAFSAAHLSNVVDWLPEARFHELLRRLVARPERPLRLVWRFIHVDRPLPPALAAVVRVDRTLGERLRATDRFPIYGVVPAVIERESGEASGEASGGEP